MNNNKSVIVVIVIAAVAVIGFLFYRQTELENRLLQQQQQAQTQLDAKEKEAAALREAQKRVFAKIEARDQARAALQAEPFKFIRGGAGWDVVYRGFFETYSRATAIELINTSQFDVADVSGKLTYLSATGEELATVPFSADGDLGAGQKKKLKITANEVTANAKQGRIVVEKVRIIGGQS